MRKILLSAMLAMGLASSAMAANSNTNTGNITIQGEYHNLSGSNYDYIKAGGVKGSYDNYSFFVKGWTKYGNSGISDVNGIQGAIANKLKLKEGLIVNSGIEYVHAKVNGGNTTLSWVYNLGLRKKLDDGTFTNVQAWYTAIDNEDDNQQLDLTIQTKLNDNGSLKGNMGITFLHNGVKKDSYAVFRAGIKKQCNDKLSGKINVTLGKNSGMIYSGGWLIENNEVDYKIGAGIGYKINNQSNVNLGIAYTSYSDDSHKTSYVANYTYQF